MDHIVKETMDIMKKGYYKCENQRVNLSLITGIYDYESVKVYTPTQLVDIFCDTDHFMKDKFYEPLNHSINLAIGTSYEIAKGYLRPLIMNLADAINPGGGCINFSNSTESKLVYATSLYQSLSSQEASQVYLFNEQNKSPMYSDFMLLSREVAVFRDGQYHYILHPYPVSILSMMPVDRYKIPHNEVKEYEIDTIMKMRIRLFFKVAARNMYRNLILVPAGFEDYGYMSYKVAQYFHEILIQEEYIDYFEQIVFAFDPNVSKHSMLIFDQVFHCNFSYKKITQRDYKPASQFGMDCPEPNQSLKVQMIPKQVTSKRNVTDLLAQDQGTKHEKKYIQACYPFPECNYTIDSNQSSSFWGYVQGILEDGTPFVAELMQTKKQKITVFFLLPFLNDMNQISKIVNSKDTTKFIMKKYDKKKPVDIWNSILCQGMQHYEQELEYDMINKYIDYLIYMNLLDLQKSDIEGFAHVLYDRAGHKVVAIEVTLKNYTRVDELVPLRFQPFMREMITEDKVESRLRIT